MNRMIAAVAGVALIVVVAVIGLGLYANRPGIGGVSLPSPTSQPSLVPTNAPTASPAAVTPTVVASAASTAPPSIVPTAAASPTKTAAGSLPQGAFVVSNGSSGLPITVVISTSGWTWMPEVEAIQKGTDVGNVPEAAELFWSFPAGVGFVVYDDPCQWESTTPKPVTTVDDFAAALAAQPSRDASEPVDVTVDGYAGKALTLHVPEDALFADCDKGEFSSYGATDETGPARYHQGPGQIDDLVILDVNGSILVIDSMYRPDTSASLVDEMRGIVESATFETP